MTGAAAARIHNDTPQAVLTHLSADDADGSLCDAWQYTLDYLCRGLDAVPGLESGIRGLLALKDDILARFRPIRDAGLNARRIRTHGELNNRPDWVKIPLEGIREIM